jgi:hypothetical protein
MDYKKHYKQLVEKYGLEVLPDNGYYERHHILPKSMGGGNEPTNLVYLTPRCHLIAHWLLMKIHNNMPMRIAYATMCSRDGIRLTPKMYEIARLAVSGANSAVARRIHTPLGWFDSVRLAAKAHGVSHPILSKKAKSNKFFHKDYYYEADVIKTAIDERGKHRARQVSTPDGIFRSVREAGQFYKVYHSTISKWCKGEREGFYMIDEVAQDKSIQAKRRVHTPLGWFDSVAMAARAHNVSGPGVISSRCKLKWKEYYYSE